MDFILWYSAPPLMVFLQDADQNFHNEFFSKKVKKKKIVNYWKKWCPLMN